MVVLTFGAFKVATEPCSLHWQSFLHTRAWLVTPGLTSTFKTLIACTVGVVDAQGHLIRRSVMQSYELGVASAVLLSRYCHLPRWLPHWVRYGPMATPITSLSEVLTWERMGALRFKSVQTLHENCSVSLSSECTRSYAKCTEIV